MNPKQKKDGKIAKITLRTLRCRGNTRKDVKKYFCWCRSEGCCCCSVVSACVLFFSVCVFLFVCFLFCWRAILSWHDQDTCTDALLGSISSFDKHLFYVCASFSSECCSPWSPFLSNSRNTLRSEDCRTQQRYKHRQWVVRNEVWFGRTRTPARPSPELKSPSSFSPRLPYGEPEPKRIPLDSLRVMGRVMRYWEGGRLPYLYTFPFPLRWRCTQNASLAKISHSLRSLLFLPLLFIKKYWKIVRWFDWGGMQRGGEKDSDPFTLFV